MNFKHKKFHLFYFLPCADIASNVNIKRRVHTESKKYFTVFFSFLKMYEKAKKKKRSATSTCPGVSAIEV